MEPGFAASEIDTTTPHPARMYDALLGGKDHYHVDQEAVRRLLGVAPETRDSAMENRAFLQRAVRFLVGEAGIRQILDIGTGIPAAGNVHQVAGQVVPGTRVVYVDNDRCKSGCEHVPTGRSARSGRRWASGRYPLVYCACVLPPLTAPQDDDGGDDGSKDNTDTRT
jgi:hypothetical protein